MSVNIIHQYAETGDETLLVPILKSQWSEDAIHEQLLSIGLPNSKALRPFFKAENGDPLLIYTDKGRRILLLTLPEPLRFGSCLKTFKLLSNKRRTFFNAPVTLDFRLFPEEQIEMLSDAAVNGLLLGSYEIGKYKQDNGRGEHPLSLGSAQISLLVPESRVDVAREGARIGEATAHTQLSIIDLVNAPSNKKTPQVLVDWAVDSARFFGYQATIFDRDQIEEMGMHALLGVNRGSEHPARFILLEYRSEQAPADQLIALVGKGVTFDTGGLSIKPSTNMYYMKSDMGGAAAVFGTIELAARLQLPVHLVGAVPVTDNSVDARAIKPSDVLDSFSGKTIEVIDTDAEGRLILADALAYVTHHYKPRHLVDLATLTGSAVRTFGYHCAAMMSNDDELADHLYRAGQDTGERVWRLPLWEEYGEEMSSEVADVRNLSIKPMAGAITAGKFLEHFTNEHPHWVHLDIAGVAFGDSGLSRDKSATGYGPRLLTTWMRSRNQNL